MLFFQLIYGVISTRLLGAKVTNRGREPVRYFLFLLGARYLYRLIRGEYERLFRLYHDGPHLPVTLVSGESVRAIASITSRT